MKILRLKEVISSTGLSKPTIWRKENEGTFPRRLVLGPNSVGWRSDEILRWIESRPRGLVACDLGNQE